MQYYETPLSKHAPRFVYGLADVCGESLAGARAIAVPGCFATAAQLALYPLAHVALAGEPSLFAITGSSGAGVHPKATTHHPARAHNVFAYMPLAHRHHRSGHAGIRGQAIQDAIVGQIAIPAHFALFGGKAFPGKGGR